MYLFILHVIGDEKQTQDENIFLVDFCLASWGGSWEWLGIDIYYNVILNKWMEGELFFTGYKDNKKIKLEVSRDGRNWKYFKKKYDNFIEYMNEYYYFQ